MYKRGNIVKKFFLNYKSTLILVLAIILGGIIGAVFKEKATVLKPFGDIFLNLLLVIVVPLIFLTITTSVANMESPKRLGKIMISIVIVFVLTSIVAVAVGFFSTYFVDLIKPEDAEKIMETLEEDTGKIGDNENIQNSELEKESDNEDIINKSVQLLTVNDFYKLLSKENIIALLIFSIIFGIAINMSGEKAKLVKEFLVSANVVVNNIVKIIMYYAPIGLGCYFATLVGSFGENIVIGYFKVFIYYTLVAILYFVLIYTLYAFLAGKIKGVKNFWKNILPSTLTALATCSSAASIPISIECAKNMEVSEDVAETTIPLGTSFHKDGSIIGSVFKIMFLVSLFGIVLNSVGDFLFVIGVALVANLLISAVPIGGGTISEMFIISVFGFPTIVLPILTIIATIIDPQATVLNVTGDISASMLVDKIVDGKKYKTVFFKTQ